MTATARRTSGWEPELPVEDTLLRRFVFCHADLMARAAAAAGGEIGSSDEASFADVRSGSALDNSVVLLQPPTVKLLDRVMRLATQFFPPERPWSLVSVWPTPDLRWRHLELVGHPPLLLAGSRSAEVSAPPGLVVSEAPSTAGLEWLLPPVTAGLLGARLVVGRGAGGDVLAAAVVAPGHGITEVGWFGTRGHGPDVVAAGTAVLAAAVGTGPEGPVCWLGTQLLTPGPGESVATALGFVPLLRTTVWMRSAVAVPTARRGTD